ncbi:MAG: DUF86 domain-containing protein [bacterium]|jgi:uncharacterized protein with HEPN domain|nr:DUF86 domain-containing protein [bacterium]
MYEKKNFTYIMTILESIEKIFLYAGSFKDPDSFFEANEQMNFNASQILLLVIGEEVKKIDQGLKSEHTGIPWREISKLRNRIAHDYRSIDPNISFDIIKNYLPELKSELLKMLDKISFERQLLIKTVKSSQYRHLIYLIGEEEE